MEKKFCDVCVRETRQRSYFAMGKHNERLFCDRNHDGKAVL
jgi:hypothetical protein